MQLSEAIQLGSTFVEEVSHAFLYGDSDNICGCALGTALAAVDESVFNSQQHPISILHKKWKWTREPVKTFPELIGVTDLYGESIATAISTIHHREILNRLQIAELCKIHEKRLNDAGINTAYTHVSESKPQESETVHLPTP